MYHDVLISPTEKQDFMKLKHSKSYDIHMSF